MTNELDIAIADYQRMLDKATTETERKHWQQRQSWLVELKGYWLKQVDSAEQPAKTRRTRQK